MGAFQGPEGLKKVAALAGVAVASSATIVPTASSALARRSAFSPTCLDFPRADFYPIERQGAVPSPRTDGSCGRKFAPVAAFIVPVIAGRVVSGVESVRERVRRSRFGPALRRARYKTRIAARQLGPTRPLPDYLILGTQKGGTNSLHDWLCEHPRVRRPLAKEIHYFDNSFQRSLSWYRAHFPLCRPGELTGEASPYYLYHPYVPERVAASLPQARLIVLLRDPVDRAISHHNHERVQGFENLPLEEALAWEPERLRVAKDRLRRDRLEFVFDHGHASYVDRGRYAEQLERWWSHVARDRMLVLFSEDLFEHPVETLRQVQEFLGLEPHVPTDLSPRNARRYAKGDDAVRRALRETFAEDNARLSALLGRPLPWDSLHADVA
jgi:hypothetical protein